MSNFVELDGIRFRERTAASPAFLSNRNLEPLYNVACVVRAFAAIQAEHPDASLVIAGDGSQRAAIEQLVRNLGVRHVTLVGKIAPERMGELYDAADVYLNAPNIDNMPNSVIEAFAAGVPVVSSDAGGIPYVVTHEVTGLLSPCDDDVALAANAVRVLRSPALASGMAARAHEECMRRYVWPAVSTRWAQLYRALMARKALA